MTYEIGQYVSVFSEGHARFFQGRIVKVNLATIEVQNGSKVKTVGLSNITVHDGEEPPVWYKPRPTPKPKPIEERAPKPELKETYTIEELKQAHLDDAFDVLAYIEGEIPAKKFVLFLDFYQKAGNNTPEMCMEVFQCTDLEARLTHLYHEIVVSQAPDLVELGEELNPSEDLVPELNEAKPNELVAVVTIPPSGEPIVIATPFLIEPPTGNALEEEDKWMKPVRYDMEHMGPYPDSFKIAGRQKINGIRHYVVAFKDKYEPWFLPGVTSKLDKVMPKEESLIKMMVNMHDSYDDYMAWLNEKAARGTVIHGAIADLVNGFLKDFDDTAFWEGYMAMACDRAGFKSKAQVWAKDVQEAILSFIRYMVDYQVVVYALEVPVCSKTRFEAGQVDIICERNAYFQKKSGKHKDTPPRVIAIDDIKTGSDSARYVAQLGSYGAMAKECFPKLVEEMRKRGQVTEDGTPDFNYGILLIKPWKSDPKYTLSDKTEKVREYMKDFDALYNQLFRMQLKPPPKVRKFHGKIDLENPSVTSHFSFTSLEEIWIERIKNGEFGEADSVNTEEEEESDGD